eukprot:1494041-Pyramimonas_sp.AAC.1
MSHSKGKLEAKRYGTMNILAPANLNSYSENFPRHLPASIFSSLGHRPGSKTSVLEDVWELSPTTHARVDIRDERLSRGRGGDMEYGPL